MCSAEFAIADIFICPVIGRGEKKTDAAAMVDSKKGAALSNAQKLQKC